jgi:hypothetical protein
MITYNYSYEIIMKSIFVMHSDILNYMQNTISRYVYFVTVGRTLTAISS